MKDLGPGRGNAVLGTRQDWSPHLLGVPMVSLWDPSPPQVPSSGSCRNCSQAEGGQVVRF